MNIQKFFKLATTALLLMAVANITQAQVDTVPGLNIKFVKVADLPASSNVAGASRANINVITRHPAVPGSTLNDRITVVDGRGPVYMIDPNGRNSPRLVINLMTASPGLNIGNTTAGNSELGVRGFAYHPDFANPSAPGYLKFFTMACYNISTRTAAGAVRLAHNVPPGAPTTCDNVLTEWKMYSAADLRANPASRREVLRFPQIYAFHGTDGLVFDPATKLLFIGAGDGGGQGDPFNVASNVNYYYGKILRIYPLKPGITLPSNMARSSDGAWAYPPANPGAGSRPGHDAYYAKGFRHPETLYVNGGNVVIADIGASGFEEIDILKISGDWGVSFGWDAVEGRFPITYTNLPPVAGYTRAENGGGATAIIVGGVPVNSLGTAFNGQLILGDLVTGRIFYGNLANMKNVRSWSSPMVTLKRAVLLNSQNQVTSLLSAYGQNNRVDLRLAEIGGTIYGTAKQRGVLFKFVAP